MPVEQPSQWQQDYSRFNTEQLELLRQRELRQRHVGQVRHAMDEQNLIDMANRIGEFFDSMPDRDEALDGIADHIRRFWEPRMRRSAAGRRSIGQMQRGDSMMPIVKEALLEHREQLTPARPRPESL